MKIAERRHPCLLDPQGNPVLSARVVHDRRRRKVVEDVLEAMRARVREAEPSQERSQPAKPHAPIRRELWLVMAIIAFAFLMTLLLSRMSHYFWDLGLQPLGAGALYGWMGFHRVGLAIH